MQIIVDGLVTQYQRTGKGKPVLLLHGWGDQANTYKALIDVLSENYDCIAPDLPGFGSSEPPKEPWNLDNYDRFIAALLKKLGVGKLTAVIGHSNGGALTIRGLSLGLISADKVVLLSSAGIRDSGSARRQLIKIVAKVGKVLTFWLPRKHRKALQKKLYGVAGSDMLVTPALKETFKLTVRQDIQKDAVKVTAPTLIIYGEDDKATPASDGETLAGLIPKASLQTLPGGHFIHQEQTEAIGKFIKDFIA